MISKIVGELLHFAIKIIVIILAVIVLVKSSQWAYAQAYDLMARTPNSSQTIRNVSLEIPKGSSTEAIANILKEKELIDSTLYFRIIAKIKGTDSKFQYGDYTFSTGMDEEAIMEILQTEGAKRATKTFTIVEGLTVAETAASLAEQGMCTGAEFYDALDHTNWGYRFLSSIPSKEERAIIYQGYLFPSTYEVYEDATATDIISAMFDQMNKIWTEDYYKQAEKQGLTVDEIMTMASIIEKEVVNPAEQPIVAGIIYNRLEDNMELQMCSTVMYVLDKHRDRLLYSDLEIVSPYNTYLTAGLPVGPIANPGAGAIKAALYPDDNNYLYFVLKDDGSGSHEFNANYSDHVNDKEKYTNTFNY